MDETTRGRSAEASHRAFFERLLASAARRRRPGFERPAPQAEVLDRARTDRTLRCLERLRDAECLRPGFSVLQIGGRDTPLLAQIRRQFPRARCYRVDWPWRGAAAVEAGTSGIERLAVYLDELFQTPPADRKGKFDVVLLDGRFELPAEVSDSTLLPQQADGWLEEYARFVIGSATRDRIHELQDRSVNLVRLQPAGASGAGSGALICWSVREQLPAGLRSWADRVDAWLSFPRWCAQNLRRHGLADACYFAGHVVAAAIGGRTPWRALGDRELRARYCATLTPRRPVRPDTVYVFAFLGEFGYELLNWQGVVRKFARLLPASSAVVIAGRKGLQPFYETAAQYVEIDDVPEYRGSYAAAYFAMAPDEFRRHRPPTEAQFRYDRDLRRALEQHVRAALDAGGRRIEFVFSSQLNAVGDCVFGADARFYGISGYHGFIYDTLDVANNEYVRVPPDLSARLRIEQALGFSLDEPYVLVQSRRRAIGPRFGGALNPAPLLDELSKGQRVVYLAFSSGRHLDSGSSSPSGSIAVFHAASFAEQSCLIAHARQCVFLTEGDLGSHTYLPPLMGQDVFVVASRELFSRRSAPVPFWNRAVFRFGGQMIPCPVEDVSSATQMRGVVHALSPVEERG